MIENKCLYTAIYTFDFGEFNLITLPNFNVYYIKPLAKPMLILARLMLRIY